MADEDTADKGAPQISHSVRDGWFTNVQRGQGVDPPGPTDQLSFDCTICCARAGDGADAGKEGSRVVAALIAALSTVVNGGLIPQAKQGGKCVVALAVAGSKLDGTGLENVHIGHIQVACIGLGEAEPWGKFDCGRWASDCVECSVDGWETAGLDVALLDCSSFFFCGLGYIVNFGEDFKKPACRGFVSELSVTCQTCASYL